MRRGNNSVKASFQASPLTADHCGTSTASTRPSARMRPSASCTTGDSPGKLCAPISSASASVIAAVSTSTSNSRRNAAQYAPSRAAPEFSKPTFIPDSVRAKYETSLS